MVKNFFSFPEYLQESQKGTLYSDDNPKDTIKDLHYGTGKESEESVQKLESLYKQKKVTHQRAVATANTMHNRAKFHANPNAGIKAGEKVWKEYLEKLKKRTKELNENILSYSEFITEKKGPCWAGYKQVGTKKKNGRVVPNCVPAN
jgi:hypothetical protein